MVHAGSRGSRRANVVHLAFGCFRAACISVCLVGVVACLAPDREEAPAPAVRAPEPESVFLPTVENDAAPPGPAPAGMVWVPGGEFSMGAIDPGDLGPLPPDTVADTQPVHRVYVEGFWMDETEVTNAQFAAFVAATGYVTVAEQVPAAEEFPGVPPEALVAGSAVFTPPPSRAGLTGYMQWWRYQPGADWRHPEGPGSDLAGRESHPVVHVAYEDAAAYAQWAGRRLPTEAEFEFAARGGLTGQPYAWGHEMHPGGESMANTYQGVFPVEDTVEDGHAGVSPVRQFPANGYGLFDMTGNVWEWVGDWYRPDYYAQLAAAGGVARNPRGPSGSFDPAEPGVPKRVQRGGSFLCTDQYCARYLVGTRGKGEVRSAAGNVGFRTVMLPDG